MRSAETMPSAASSASSTARRGPVSRPPAARTARSASRMSRTTIAGCRGATVPRATARRSRLLQLCAPALLDPPVAPDHDRPGPGDHEEGDDEVADEVEVEVG